MQIYKENQFLVFVLDDGKTVKYDFAKKQCIGKNGKQVNDLRSQLKGITVHQLCDACADKNYGKFIKFVQSQGSYYGRNIYNIGSILENIPFYSKYEQIFSAGFDGVYNVNAFHYRIQDIPKSLIKLCKTHTIRLSNDLVEYYLKYPDAYYLAYTLDYMSLDDNDIYKILTHKSFMGEPYFVQFCDQYGYSAKALLLYLDRLKTYEAINDMYYLLKELKDYADMMRRISPKFDRFPRHFLTTHKIAARNYNRLRQHFEEEDFKSRIDKGMEHTFGDLTFLYPDSTKDIKDESVAMNNCVSSYIQRVIDGKCHILFLRNVNDPDKSLVTIEVQNGKIVQALQKFNDPLNEKQQIAVDKWNAWYANKMTKNESEEMKNVG